MKRSTKILLGLGALAIMGSLADAQVPGLFITSPTGFEQINVQSLGPQIVTIRLRQARDAVGYSKQSPSTGFSLTFGDGQSVMQIGGGTTLATGTITMAPNPVDGQNACFYTKPIVTSLTVSANTGQTINDAVTAAAATTQYCYTYSLSNTTWDRTR